jgi:apolipoprotein N-acyltransferase
MQVAKFIAAWVMVVFVGALAAIILWKIWTGKIDLTKLISEANGDASMSRFQFLLFTFVVVLMWIYLFFCQDCKQIPPLDNSVLGLLGISGGSYIVSKGIQKSHETEVAKSKAEVEKSKAVAGTPQRSS